MDKAKLTSPPDLPGVYIFKDKHADCLYIGKSRSLKKRVCSYFTRPLSFKTQIMVSKIDDVDYIVTKSESQARLLEAKLIKEKLPVYNTVFRDDKSFPVICISNETFPVVWIARKTGKRFANSLYYYGPYANSKLLRQAIKSIRSIFGFRSCFKLPKRACLYYRLKLCPAPCIKKISSKKYRELIKNIILFLEGRQEDLIRQLTATMNKLADKKRFEEAVLIRNQIQALSSVFPQPAPHLGTYAQESAELKRALGLKRLPQRIEAFDVSNIFGASPCASMVSFYKGKPDKNNYRRFRIKTVSGIDDYQMLEEAVERRYRRLIKEDLLLPDLIIIDGGKGQLNIVRRKLHGLGLRLAVISIAKSAKTSDFLPGRQEEAIYIYNQETPIKLKPNSLALRLIQRVRDEAHRFALAYHHILRRKETLGK